MINEDKTKYFFSIDGLTRTPYINMKILALETSCDETAVTIAVADEKKFRVLSAEVFSQIKTHRKTGGVVPEVAARAHAVKLPLLFDRAFKKAKLSVNALDVVAVTAGPGLITSLLVGVETARVLSWQTGKKLVGVNHLQGHLASAMIPDNGERWTAVKYPMLALVVSGGHTELLLLRGSDKVQKLGATLDDAAGEAFDKVAKILGLPYPGGPEIEKTAKGMTTGVYDLPRPMSKEPNYNFSFAGLKTAVLYRVRGQALTATLQKQMAADFQLAIIESLLAKVERALVEFKPASVSLVGGVSANQALRDALGQLIIGRYNDVQLILPSRSLATDNATMIAAAAYFQARAGKFITWQKLSPNPRLKL